MKKISTKHTIEPASESEPESLQPIDRQERIVSLAGQVTALWASRVEVVEADVGQCGRPTLEINEIPMFAGFNSHAMTPDDPLPAIREHVEQADRPMGYRMLLAQLRAIYAGIAALDYASMTMNVGFGHGALWEANESWASNLLNAFADLMGIDEHTLEDFADEADVGAREIVSSNWARFCMTSLALLQGRYPSGATFQRTRISVRFPLTAKYAEKVASFSADSARRWASLRPEAVIEKAMRGL